MKNRLEVKDLRFSLENRRLKITAALQHIYCRPRGRYSLIISELTSGNKLERALFTQQIFIKQFCVPGSFQF